MSTEVLLFGGAWVCFAIAVAILVASWLSGPVTERDERLSLVDQELDDDADRLWLIAQARQREDRALDAEAARGRISRGSPWRTITGFDGTTEPF